ncbi:MAG TPA: hypothetical protein VFT82_02410 [Candidatus Paceibacterota bacterium]|nr:hypothetical protein [Candidatus Paceibacterota bacterium]
MRRIIRFFDKLEDKVREHLSHFPIIYSIIGGTFVVLFWRAVWHTADLLMAQGGWLQWFFYEPTQLVVTIIGLLMTGLMVSVFIGDRIILSGLHHEKKLEEATEELVKEEVVSLLSVRNEIRALKKEIEALKK